MGRFRFLDIDETAWPWQLSLVRYTGWASKSNPQRNMVVMWWAFHHTKGRFWGTSSQDCCVGCSPDPLSIDIITELFWIFQRISNRYLPMNNFIRWAKRTLLKSFFWCKNNRLPCRNNRANWGRKFLTCKRNSSFWKKRTKSLRLSMPCCQAAWASPRENALALPVKNIRMDMSRWICLMKRKKQPTRERYPRPHNLETVLIWMTSCRGRQLCQIIWNQISSNNKLSFTRLSTNEWSFLSIYGLLPAYIGKIKELIF